MSTAIILGGYGTFGALVARELVRSGMTVTIAGRDARRAEALARSLGPPHGARAVDVNPDATSCQDALTGQNIAVNCAGSLVSLGPGLLEACLQTGCHYVDIAVERDHTALVRGHGDRFRQAGLSAVYGCSSLPAISGALALAARAARSDIPERVRVTLFIGNKNPKGRAAIESLVRILGQPIPAPQGTVRGFRDREVVVLPPPFGKRAVFNFDSPEYDLFPELLGTRAVSVKVGLELRAATYGFALLAVLGWNSPRLAPWLERFGTWMGWWGTSGGAIMTELFYADGTHHRATLVARTDGQRLAALPCALVAQALCQGNVGGGALTAYELLGANQLLEQMSARGYEMHLFPCSTCAK